MMRPYDLIITDLDDTLLNSQKEIGDLTLQVLLKLQQEGVKLILASGRPRPELDGRKELLKLEEYEGYVISYNGSRIINLKTNEILYDRPVPIDLAKEIISYCKKFKVSVVMGHHDKSYITNPSIAYAYKEASVSQQRVVVDEALDQHLDFEPSKLLICGEHEELLACYKQFQQQFNNLDFMFSSPIFIEVMQKGISKGSSLVYISDKLQIPLSRVIAFGDNENDLTMIQCAGKGVAMGNAVKSLKAIADEVTLSCDQEGLAHTLIREFKLEGELWNY